jgi:hypothetical protein
VPADTFPAIPFRARPADLSRAAGPRLPLAGGVAYLCNSDPEVAKSIVGTRYDHASNGPPAIEARISSVRMIKPTALLPADPSSRWRARRQPRPGAAKRRGRPGQRSVTPVRLRTVDAQKLLKCRRDGLGCRTRRAPDKANKPDISVDNVHTPFGRTNPRPQPPWSRRPHEQPTDRSSAPIPASSCRTHPPAP